MIVRRRTQTEIGFNDNLSQNFIKEKGFISDRAIIACRRIGGIGAEGYSTRGSAGVRGCSIGSAASHHRLSGIIVLNKCLCGSGSGLLPAGVCFIRGRLSRQERSRGPEQSCSDTSLQRDLSISAGSVSELHRSSECCVFEPAPGVPGRSRHRCGSSAQVLASQEPQVLSRPEAKSPVHLEDAALKGTARLRGSPASDFGGTGSDSGRSGSGPLHASSV